MAEVVRPELAWVVDCSRCANQGQSDASNLVGAVVDLTSRGWTDCCPACNGNPS